MMIWTSFLRFSLLFTICIGLAGCDPKLDFIEFNDTIIKYSFTDHDGVAFGLKGWYIVYGDITTPAGEKFRAGTCILINPPRAYNYFIKELLRKYPQLGTEEALKASAAQENVYRNRDLPDFVDPEDLSRLNSEVGAHGQ